MSDQKPGEGKKGFEDFLREEWRGVLNDAQREHLAKVAATYFSAEQIADLTARLKQAEAERDAARAEADQLRGFFVRTHEGETNHEALQRWLGETYFKGVSYRILCDQFQKSAQQSQQQLDAALAKLAEVEAGAAAMRLEAETVYQEMEATCNEDDGRERGSFWVPYYRGFQTKLAAIIDAATAGTELLEDLQTLRTALEQYADPGNWHVGSKYDGESRSFTGPDEARKALDETERGDGQ